MLKLLSKYLTVGVINTLIHWGVFVMFLYLLHTNQAVANFVAFCIAVTFSFFANAKFTFKARTTTFRYVSYTGFMGAMSILAGWFADFFNLPALFTLVGFSAISLVSGFLYSKFVVFRSNEA